jgi:hypothetical protein
MIRDSTGSIEDQERSALDEFLGGIRDFGGSLIYGPGPEGGVSNNFPGTPNDSGDTPFTGSTPALTPEQALEKWFEDNRGAPAQEIFNVMQANNVSPEYVINAWGLDPTSAKATYDTFLNSATATATPPAAQTDESLLGSILGGAKGVATTAVDAAKSAADTLLAQIKEILPFYDQAQVVLNPRTGKATIVFGTPPSGYPVIQAGNLPSSNTNVGITTGISILDQAINSVLGREGGLKSGSIRDEVIKIILEQTGASPAATAGILGEDLDTILSTANVKAAEAATRLGVDLIGGNKGVVGDGGTGVVRNGGTGATLGGGKIITGAADSPIVTGAADSPIVTGAADSPIVTGAADAVDIVTGSLTPADLGEDTTVKTGGGDSSIVTGGGGGGSPATPATPLYGQGIRSMKTEKAGVTPLEDVFDIGDMSLANVLRLLAGEDDNTQGTPYYGGGSVNKNSSVDELIRLLRG